MGQLGCHFQPPMFRKNTPGTGKIWGWGKRALSRWEAGAPWEWFHGIGSMGMAPWHGGVLVAMSHSPHIHGISVGWDLSPLSIEEFQDTSVFPGNAQNVKEARSVCEAGMIPSWGQGRGRKTRIARGIQRKFQRELEDLEGAAEFGLIL